VASRLGPAFSDSSVLAPGFGVAREFSQGIIFSEHGVRVRQSLTPKRRLVTPSVCATRAVARRICCGASLVTRWHKNGSGTGRTTHRSAKLRASFAFRATEGY